MARRARVQVGVTLTQEQAARAEELASAQGISVQELLRRLLGEAGAGGTAGDSGAGSVKRG